MCGGGGGGGGTEKERLHQCMRERVCLCVFSFFGGVPGYMYIYNICLMGIDYCMGCKCK